MDFLRNHTLFDLTYGGRAFLQEACTITKTEDCNVLTTVYELADGLRITNIAKKYGDSYEWVNWFENTSDKPTEIISDLYDTSVSLPLPHEEPIPWTAFQPEFEDVTSVYAPTGSTWSFNEFCDFPDHSVRNVFTGHIPPGIKKEYSASGGRSSENNAPFFNVHKGGRGYIFAIGWTGQWNCFLERRSDDIIVKTRIEDTGFRILPGEKFRTMSFVLMPYECSIAESHNKWRRLLKEHYSLIGQEGRDSQGPLCAGIWGGMKTSSALARIEAIQKQELPFEYIWMDAGWYGQNTLPSPDEFEGNWGDALGDWRVSPHIHPGQLKDVVAAVHEAGKKFILWFEPERIIPSAPVVGEHPEYFIYPDGPDPHFLLLDLGNEDAWNYCFNTLSEAIENIGIDCYRQDFNMPPLPFWRLKDTKDRRGITEIKHINGLYRLWDALLDKFPHLLIDNCASGGRRIDIETLRRSIPLWRSDFQCPANYLTEGAQCHNLTFNLWMPYSGTGCGRDYDTYRFRSSYSPALTTNFTYSERNTFGDDPAKTAWLKKMLNEYLCVRPYMSEDFYSLTQVSDRRDVWCASQFNRPCENDGILLLFRREKSPYENATFFLNGIDQTKDYIFTDADSDEEFTLSGAFLLENGLNISIKDKRSSKLYFYRKKQD